MSNRVESRGRAVGVVAVLALVVSILSVGSAGAQEQTVPKWLERNPVPEGAPFEIGDVGANGRVQFSGPLARVYGEAGDGYALIAGADMLSVCTDEVPPSKPGIAYRGDGHFVIRTAPGGEQVRTYLYKTDLGCSSSSMPSAAGSSRTGRRSRRRLRVDSQQCACSNGRRRCRG